MNGATNDVRVPTPAWAIISKIVGFDGSDRSANDYRKLIAEDAKLPVWHANAPRWRWIEVG